MKLKEFEDGEVKLFNTLLKLSLDSPTSIFDIITTKKVVKMFSSFVNQNLFIYMSLRKMCLYSELFWENTDQNNSEYGHISYSELH